MITTFLWFKAFHIIFMVIWFFGLFYICRLFVYHVQNWKDPLEAKTFTLMERRLIYIVMYPAMVLTLVFGLLMVSMVRSILAQPWFIIKLAGILGLMIYHFYTAYVHSRMLDGKRPLSEKACRVINEVPIVLLILIVVMSVLRPSFS